MINEDNKVIIEIEVTYGNNIYDVGSINASKGKIELNSLKVNTKVEIDKSKIKGSFIEKELNKSKSGNYIKIVLNTKQKNFNPNTLIDCIEYINDKNYEIEISKDNYISLLVAFQVCELYELKNDLLGKMMHDLEDENVINFIQIAPMLKSENINKYVYYIIKHIINISNGLNDIQYANFYFNNIVKISQNSKFSFDNTHIYYTNPNKTLLLPNAGVSFVKEVYQAEKNIKSKYITANNYFNIGVITFRKNTNGIISDYPHYYQMEIENDKSLSLYAIREYENSNFIISSNPNDYTKYGEHYIGEVSVNFWGTSFTVYDYGYDKDIYSKCPKKIMHLRNYLGDITYESNIMGDCPRSFTIEVFNIDDTSDNNNNSKFILENVKPKYNYQMGCYTLNFYGRVKKASAKNFQIILKDEPDDIILQHGKVKKNEYNIDFRDPFCPLFAFAVSLAAIGKKRVVS